MIDKIATPIKKKKIGLTAEYPVTRTNFFVAGYKLQTTTNVSEGK